jgi:hypothetical protein
MTDVDESIVETKHPVPDESWRQFNKSCPFPATVPKRTTVDFNIELDLKLGQNWRTVSRFFWRRVLSYNN